MRMTIFVMSLAALTALVTGCSKSSGSSDQGVMGQAVKPGYFPDGTKAAPVTKEQAQQVIQTFSGTLAVLDALSQATPSAGFNPLYTVVPSNTDSSLAQLVQQNCSVFSPNVQPAGDLNQSSIVRLQGQGSVSGVNCPLSGKSTIDGEANVSTSKDSSGQLQSFSASGQVRYHEDLSATNQLPPQYDFKSMSTDLSFTGQMAGSQSSQSISANIEGHAVINTQQFQNLDADLLSEINVSTQQGHPSGDVKVAIIIKTPAQKLLIQIFANASDPHSGQVYVNGQLVTNPFPSQNFAGN